MWIAVHCERLDTLELSKPAERQLKDVLQTVGGVSQVVIGGGKTFAIRVWPFDRLRTGSMRKRWPRAV